MRRTTLLPIALVLVFGLASCTDAEREDFSLSGVVVDTDADVAVPTDIDIDIDTDDDDGDADDNDVDVEDREVLTGTLTIESDDAVEGCEDTGRYVVYFTADTDFEPDAAGQDDDFPDTLDGLEVDVEGNVYHESDEGDDEGCVLVANEVEVGDDDGVTDDDPTPTPDADATDAAPVETDEPTAEPTDEPTASPEVTADVDVTTEPSPTG